MSWVDSKSCTPLKRDFLREWFAQEQRFFLTGGSALGLFYLDHRRSYDLDLFTTETAEAKEVQNLILRVSEKIGAHCTAVRSAPDFHRFKLARGDDREIIDVVVDRAPQVDALKASVDGIRVDTLREILANKLTTLVSRSEVVNAATTDVKKHPGDQFTENLLHRRATLCVTPHVSRGLTGTLLSPILRSAS
jgi:hypothetical protein